jgi:hypothetical protein
VKSLVPDFVTMLMVEPRKDEYSTENGAVSTETASIASTDRGLRCVG